MAEIVGNNSKKVRAISNLVGSRWYRAPEISLLQKSYDQAQDMWSLGCVIFEILQMARPAQSPAAPTAYTDRVLFPGDSCFPLSMRNNGRGGAGEKKVSEKD